ncbi:MAG: DUF7305 domain-containing protein, partial [Chitinivibrionales bacterium]
MKKRFEHTAPSMSEGFFAPTVLVYFILMITGSGLLYASDNSHRSFVIFSERGTDIKDRNMVSGDIGSNTYCELGASSIIENNNSVVSGGDVFLRSSSVVTGDVVSGGSLTSQAGSVVEGEVLEGADVEDLDIPERVVEYGEQDITVYHGQSDTIIPGDYSDLKVYDRGSIHLSPGEYNFREFSAGPDVVITMDLTSEEPVHINTADKLHFSDRLTIETTGSDRPELVEFYTNQSGSIRIGTDTDFRGVLTAPHAELTVYSRTEILGALYADKVVIEPDVGSIEEVEQDWIPPDVVITSPEEGYLTNETPIDVAWTVDGEEQTTDLTEDLSEGENIVIRSSTDEAGNTGADTVAVSLDTTPPDVVITSPEEGFLTNETPIDVSWTVDGVDQTTQLTEDLSEGENLVIRSSTDEAGNTGADTVAVSLDTTPPDVVITSPEEGFLTNETPIDVSWTVDGVDQTTQLTEDLSEGENLVIRSSTDEAGNTGADTVA